MISHPAGNGTYFNIINLAPMRPSIHLYLTSVCLLLKSTPTDLHLTLQWGGKGKHRSIPQKNLLPKLRRPNTRYFADAVLPYKLRNFGSILNSKHPAGTLISPHFQQAGGAGGGGSGQAKRKALTQKVMVLCQICKV